MRSDHEEQLERLAQETARWWIAARAGWNGLRERGLTFGDAAFDYLKRFPYLMSVPLQQSPEFEGGRLAEGYALLLAHIDKQEEGFVLGALARLNPQFGTRDKDQIYPLSQELYLHVVAEGRLYKTYPDFVREVVQHTRAPPGAVGAGRHRGGRRQHHALHALGAAGQHRGADPHADRHQGAAGAAPLPLHPGPAHHALLHAAAGRRDAGRSAQRGDQAEGERRAHRPRLAGHAAGGRRHRAPRRRASTARAARPWRSWGGSSAATGWASSTPIPAATATTSSRSSCAASPRPPPRRPSPPPIASSARSADGGAGGAAPGPGQRLPASVSTWRKVR